MTSMRYWMAHGAMALKACALIAVLAVIGVMASHGAAIDDATNDAATLAATMIAPTKPIYNPAARAAKVKPEAATPARGNSPSEQRSGAEAAAAGPDY